MERCDPTDGSPPTVYDENLYTLPSDSKKQRSADSVAERQSRLTLQAMTVSGTCPLQSTDGTSIIPDPMIADPTLRNSPRETSTSYWT